MVLLMLTLELVLSTIGSAIVYLLSFAVTLAPYALLALPLYIFYRLGRMVWPTLRGWRRKPAVKAAAGRKAPPRRAAPPAPLRVRAEAPPPTKAAANAPPNARIYGEGMDILTRQMRGPLRRGDIPWFLAFGVGGPALLATDPTHVRWPEDGNGENGCWWFCEGAAILHAGADSADGSRLAASWPALVAAMRKRPMRRPLDGVLLMVGADELRAAAERPGPRDALAKRGAALRERLRTLRDDVGVVGPVHVVVVRAEALDGFTDLCAAVPSALLDGVLGWTNPQDWAKPFDPRRIDEAFEAIAADIAVLEADAFAAGTAGVRLPLLPASLDTLRHPLALFLDGALGGDDQSEPFPLRGIALTGAYAPATGGRRPVFARDLLPGRAFAEAGYGRPSDAAYQQAHKRRRMAQAALAASVAGLSVAAWQGVSSVSAGSPPVAAATADLRRALLARDAVTDGALAGRVIAATAVMERNPLATPLLPTSLFSGFDEDKKRLASVTLRRSVLRPIRDALLPSATMADLPPVANPQRVEDLPAFRRLAEQLDRTGGRRDALERYDRFRRNSGFDELNALAESVYGAVPRSPMTATDGYITRIAAGADLPNLDARTIAAAVRAESVQLAAPLAEELYGRNPLRQRAEALAERLRGLPETPTAEDVDDVRRLTGAVAESVAWPIAGALQEPARGLPDAIRVMLQKAAIADLPGRDTTDRITEALSTAATGARAAVLALDAPQAGALFAVGDGGALVLNPAVTALPDALAAALPATVPDAPPAEAAKPAEPKPEQAKTVQAKTEQAKPAEAKPAEAKSVMPEAEPAKPVAAAPPPPPRPAPEPAALPPAVVEQPAVVAHLPIPPRMPAEAPVPDGDLALSKLSTAFAQTLAGRFPFVGTGQSRGAPDADPQDVRRFFRQLDEHRAAVMRTATPEVAAFMERMEAARPLLEAIARPSPVSVRLTYGANRAQEVGAEHIIDWSVRSGASAVGASANGGTLAWTPGQPVLLSARWAAGSPFRPKGAPAGGTAAATGDTITLAERGPWALLRLLKGHAPSSSRDGLLLRVALPTQTIEGQPVRDTVLVLGAAVSAGARGELPARALDLPVRFPQR